MVEKINYLKFFFDSGKYEDTSEADSIADYLPGSICIYNPEFHRLIYKNREAEQKFGLSEMISDLSLFIDKKIHPADQEATTIHIGKLGLLGTRESYHFTARLKDSSRDFRLYKISGTMLQRDSSKPGNILLTAQAMIDQMKPEIENETRIQLFEETERLLQFGSWSWDAKTDQVKWSSGLYEILGYTQEDVGENVSNEFYLSHVLPEHLEYVRSAVEDAIAQGEDFECEYSIRTQRGDVKIVSTKGKIIKGLDGQVEKVLGITRDITSVRNFEREQEKNLRELNRSNKELEEFAYVASHDLQEPLRKIAMFSERLRSKYGSSLEKEGQLFMDRILASADNMRTLIDNLLEFSRANRSSQAFVALDLKTVLDQVKANLELKIEETKAKIELSNPLAKVEAVSSEMEQLFSNLLSNAIKFRKEGQPPVITITTHKATRQQKMHHHLRADRTYYVIEVTDNGIGFEEEYSEKIFQIFQRLHGKTEYPGSGIGLAICKRIVDNHNGVILANSKPGDGATFTVIIPEKQF